MSQLASPQLTPSFAVEAASKSLLAERYHVSVRTLMEWLAQAGHSTYGRRKTLRPREVANVYKILGPPEQYMQLEIMTA